MARINSWNEPSLKQAIREGYRVSEPKWLSRQIAMLCNKLGAEYHAARYGVRNIAHRVIGNGWSVAVYPTRLGREYYVVELMCDYGRKCDARVHGIPEQDIGKTIGLLQRKYVLGDVALTM